MPIAQKDIDGVATFEFKDSYNFNSVFEQLCISIVRFNLYVKICITRIKGTENC